MGDRPEASVCCAAEETELELLLFVELELFGCRMLGNSEETGLIVTRPVVQLGGQSKQIENTGRHHSYRRQISATPTS